MPRLATILLPEYQEDRVRVETPIRTQITVRGMTCQHCVMSVTEEISEIDGVSGVQVELETGAVTVLSERELTTDEITAAVTGAGFQLA